MHKWLFCFLLIGVGNWSISWGQVRNRSGEDSTIFISHTVFLPDYAFPSGARNWDVTLGNFDQDAELEVISLDRKAGKIWVHQSDGKGDLSTKAAYPTLPQGRNLISLPGTARPDLAVLNVRGQVQILQNDGQGRFQPTQTLQAGRLGQGLAARLHPHTAQPELLVPGQAEGQIYPFLRQADGQFKPGTPFKTGPTPRAVAVGDISGDGIDDLVVGCDGGRIYWHQGQANGQWADPVSLRSTAATWSLALADFDGDGQLDIAAASAQDRMLFVHRNLGGGRFAREQEIISGDHNFDVVAVDADLDGDLDLITCSTLDKGISFHLNDGRGVFGAQAALTSGDWNAALAAGDMDGDGDPDLVVAGINDGALHLHRNIAADTIPARTEPACLRGRIWDKDAQKWLAGTIVTLRYPDGRFIETQQSDDSAAFKFCPPTQHPYQLVVKHPDFPRQEVPVFLPDTGAYYLIELEQAKGAYIYGGVFDRKTGRGLPDATIRLQPATDTLPIPLALNAKAGFRQSLPFGAYIIEASQPGYSSSSKTIDLHEGHIGTGLKVLLPLDQIQRPTEGCVIVTVRDAETEAIIPGARVEIETGQDGVLQTLRANAAGQIRTCLPAGQYTVSAAQQGYFFAVEALKVVAQTEDIHAEIALKPLVENGEIILRNIYFDVDKAILRDSSITELARVQRIMLDNPGLVVEIAGHTDSDATEAYNQRLSEARAAAVVVFLTEKNIAPHRMQSRGYGESKPVVPNDSPENKQKNRRTAFRVLRLGAE